MEFEHIAFAFGLTLFAGLSTGIGSAIAFFAKKTNTAFLSVALGFSAGVMIYVSFVEIMVKARDELTAVVGETEGHWLTAAGFFGGILFIAIIDKLIPSAENPHEMHKVEEMEDEEKMKSAKLMRMGLFTALAIAIHNFPEGLATFTAALTDPTLGIAIAVAIAIHNIPEGIAVSVPIFYATGSRRRAFTYSFLSGVAEPVGALIGYAILLPFLTPALLSSVVAFVAGIMIYISLDEILPLAHRYGQEHLVIIGVGAGMLVMAASLWLLQ